MSTSEAEQADLEAFKAARVTEQIRCWTLCRAYVGMSQEELRHSGHKSQADAVLYTVKDSVKRVNKLWADFLKKWPDK